jgi:AcrR family transcriptional regulator
MTPEQRREQVEQACAQLVAEGLPITFDDVALRAGLGRATLYRHPDLRAVVEEQRLRGREAGTLTGLSADIAHLRTALEAIAGRVRSHEEELRKLRRP